ncbi:MAG: outer membrane protein assembly factor BamD [Desulfobulbaceae bacterium]|nr:outer membrane protein assembly factor BamD [Desulfobulbaceae bacterium]HIJ78577.1 outer membrane protein assembly factor BamD [Deltaproteobacteria bacterium]
MIFAKENSGFVRAFILCLSLGLSGVGLSGCATFDRVLDWTGLVSSGSDAQTPEALAMRAMDDFNHGSYRSALKTFEEIKDRYPFSDVALLAELKSADAKYHLDEYGEALVLYGDFEANHPTNEAIPYVFFQIGMCSYKQIGTVDRDPAKAANAIQAFARLNRTYPQSPYFQEANARIMAARDFLAQHEFYVATFYVRTDEYSQAQGRLEYLQATYPDSSVAPKAAELLAELKSGKPLAKSWRRFIPQVSLPSWQSFTSAIGISSGIGAPVE